VKAEDGKKMRRWEDATLGRCDGRKTRLTRIKWERDGSKGEMRRISLINVIDKEQIDEGKVDVGGLWNRRQ
jgi:hypothetical protein